MSLSEQERNDLLLFWSGELTGKRQKEIQDLLESNPDASDYLEELESLKKFATPPKENDFQPINIEKAFHEFLEETEVKPVTNRSDSLSPDRSKIEKFRSRRLVQILAISVAIIGLILIAQHRIWQPPEKKTAFKNSSPIVKAIRVKRKRLKWLQTRTRKIRQLNYVHRSTIKARWQELRNKKPRKAQS